MKEKLLEALTQWQEKKNFPISDDDLGEIIEIASNIGQKISSAQHSMEERLEEFCYGENGMLIDNPQERLPEFTEFIKKEINLAVSKDRERIVEMIEKHDWECFEQTRIKKDIINFINNTTTNKTP